MLSLCRGRAGFTIDGLIIHIDTDDVISQLPGNLSSIFQWTGLQMLNSEPQKLKLDYFLSTVFVFDVNSVV